METEEEATAATVAATVVATEVAWRRPGGGGPGGGEGGGGLGGLGGVDLEAAARAAGSEEATGVEDLVADLAEGARG